MLTRKEQQKSPNQFPQSWKDEVEQLMTSIYGANFESQTMTIEVYGLTYPNEIVLTASYLDSNDQNKIPVTYQVSADLDEKTKTEKLMQTLVDSIGLFFDDFFQSHNSTQNKDDESVYIPRWQETSFKGEKIYYRVSRENIGLTLKANELLNN